MVPTQFRRLLALPDDVRARADVSSLRHVIHSAAPCPVDVKRRMLAWWGNVIYEYYAASEGGGTLATPQEWLDAPGHRRQRVAHLEAPRVVKDDGTECAPREVGTVYMSMGAHTFEYHKDKEKTASTWKDDFFTVGDAGYLDEDGFLFLCDRKSDMIISGGVNIYPAEIESVLGGAPQGARRRGLRHPGRRLGRAGEGGGRAGARRAAPGPALADELLAFCQRAPRRASSARSRSTSSPSSRATRTGSSTSASCATRTGPGASGRSES